MPVEIGPVLTGDDYTTTATIGPLFGGTYLEVGVGNEGPVTVEISYGPQGQTQKSEITLAPGLYAYLNGIGARAKSALTGLPVTFYSRVWLPSDPQPNTTVGFGNLQAGTGGIIGAPPPSFNLLGLSLPIVFESAYPVAPGGATLGPYAVNEFGSIAFLFRDRPAGHFWDIEFRFTSGVAGNQLVNRASTYITVSASGGGAGLGSYAGTIAVQAPYFWLGLIPNGPAATIDIAIFPGRANAQMVNPGADNLLGVTTTVALAAGASVTRDYLGGYFGPAAVSIRGSAGPVAGRIEGLNASSSIRAVPWARDDAVSWAISDVYYTSGFYERLIVTNRHTAAQDITSNVMPVNASVRSGI